jgi:hypothetical protein
MDRALTESGDPDATIEVATHNVYVVVTRDELGGYHVGWDQQIDEARSKARRAAGSGYEVVITFSTIDGPID